MASKHILITGANAGLGFDSARQFAASGRWDTVVISARSQAKADDAINRLVEATGLPAVRFGAAIFDNNQPDTVRAAVAALTSTGRVFEAVILNAGGVPNPDASGAPRRTGEGLSELFAMNVGGHALLVQGLLEAGLLAEGATVMFAGSEASRGIPSMRMATPVLPEGFGDAEAAVEAVSRADHFGKGYDPMVDYGLVKLIGTAWMRHLSQTHGLRALTVSPGFTLGTEVMDDLPPVQKFMFRYVAGPVMRLLGNAHGVETGAARYRQAIEDPALTAGGFYASPGTKVSGPLTAQDAGRQPLLADAGFTAAVGRVIDRLVGASAPGLRAAG